MIDEPEQARRGARLEFRSRRAARVVFVSCLILEVALVLFDYHVNYGRLTNVGAVRRLANIAREDGLASWFGTTQTFFVALTAWAIWYGVRAADAPRWRRLGWLLVAVLFTYMAADDGAQIHERLGTAYRSAAGPGSSLFPSFAWQLLFVPMLGTAVLASGYFLYRELQHRASIVMIGAAVVMFAVAVGLDFLEGLEPDHPWNPYSAIAARADVTAFARARFGQPAYEMVLHFSRSFEEFLEMLANTCFWSAIVGHIGVSMPDIHFRP